MRQDGLLRHLAVAFGIALVVYLVAYSGIQNRRTRRGPWEVTFTNSVAGAPALIINQPALSLTNIQIVFAGKSGTISGTSGAISFDQPRPVPFDVPFGKCIFMDLTFLPGTLVFDLNGHEIQLIPRVITIDKQERPWRSNSVIEIPADPSR